MLEEAQGPNIENGEIMSLNNHKPTCWKILIYYLFQEGIGRDDQEYQWFRRSRFCFCVAIIWYLMLSLLGAAFLVVNPLNYVVGLLWQLVIFGKENITYNYWDNILKFSGFAYLTLIVAFFGSVILVYLITLVICCIKGCLSGYQQYQNYLID